VNRYVVTYHRAPIRLPDGRMTTDSFRVVDKSTALPLVVSQHITRDSAVAAALALNTGSTTGR
jgi:hypothetical protein